MAPCAASWAGKQLACITYLRHSPGVKAEHFDENKKPPFPPFVPLFPAQLWFCVYSFTPPRRVNGGWFYFVLFLAGSYLALTPVLSVRVLFCRVSVSVDISGQFTLTKRMNPFKGKRFGDAEILVLNK